MNPTAPSEREPVLDALRGFAVLGILLVNVEVMRGTEWFVLLMGGAPPEHTGIDRAVRFAIGWLATGKFVSSLALLFGVGAALLAERSIRAGESPRPLLARRYLALAAFGIAHMLLLFPGDILFVYGLAGFMLLAFVRLRVRTLLVWALGILAVYGALGLRYLSVVSPPPSGFADELEAAIREQQIDALAAYSGGSYAEIVLAHVWQAPLIQIGQLFALPWIVALFLLGYSVARAGVFGGLAAHRALLVRGTWIGLGIGLPLNFGLGFLGPLAGFGAPSADEPLWVTRWVALAQTIGQPVLAIGYLCALALYWLRRGAPAPLAAVGRMALSAYIAQSALGLAAFAALRQYEQLSPASALSVALGCWVLLLIVCPLWLRAFRMGPLEWLWRSLAYGRLQPLRNPPRPSRVTS